MITNSELEYLVKNYIENNLTPTEEGILIKLLTDSPTEETLEQFDFFYNKFHKTIQLEEEKKDAVWQEIHSHLGVQKNFQWRKLLPYAAILIGLLLITGIIFKYNDHTKIAADRHGHLATEQILLRKNKGTILILDSLTGKFKPIDHSVFDRYGIAKDSSDILTFKNTNQRIAYQNTLLTISTHPGQVQKLILPDGTKVWINSNSQLCFPTHFDSKIRQVSLTGEAYFEVAHVPAQPFRVKGSHYNTEVLGTHFNVQSYPAGLEKITLLEGRVKVSNHKGSVYLSPGQQALGTADQPTKINVDTLDVLAWKKGYLTFDNVNLEQLTAQIKEWYNVKFIIIRTKNQDRFSGTYKRTNSLSDLLKNIEAVSDLKFDIKEGGLYVENKP